MWGDYKVWVSWGLAWRMRIKILCDFGKSNVGCDCRCIRVSCITSLFGCSYKFPESPSETFANSDRDIYSEKYLEPLSEILSINWLQQNQKYLGVTCSKAKSSRIRGGSNCLQHQIKYPTIV
ncbi:hypothetical protein C5167_039171 [Papaver somniferum]|uniref:Uncharacterized protein n=2 Tax=Papaver somniferum TaxID=3469 RepID=A0A4Y7IBD0_PAPSO|nr:hypothetical protein C5167_039171 [Papaver somniferum]